MQNWDDLRFFLAVADGGSISAAAERLGVNQSTVSRRIHAFEKELDVRLFERLSSGYLLTREGEELERYARRIGEEASAIDRHIMGSNIELAGPIRITTSLMLYRYLLPPILKQFNETHPGIELRLDLSNNLYNISQREADVAIRVSNEELPENLIARDLGRILLAPYGERRYIKHWRDTKPKPPLRWIGEDNTEARPGWLPKSIQKLQLTLRTNEVMATVDAVKAGMGVGRLPRYIGDSESSLERFPTDQDLPHYPVWLMMHADMRRVYRIRVFNDFVVEHMRRELAKYE